MRNHSDNLGDTMNHPKWIVQEIPLSLTHNVELEWYVIDKAMTRIKQRHSNLTEIVEWRYVTRHEASWLVGQEAYKNPNTAFLYCWTGVDQIAEVTGEL